MSFGTNGCLNCACHERQNAARTMGNIASAIRTISTTFFKEGRRYGNRRKASIPMSCFGMVIFRHICSIPHVILVWRPVGLAENGRTDAKYALAKLRLTAVKREPVRGWRKKSRLQCKRRLGSKEAIYILRGKPRCTSRLFEKPLVQLC